MRKWMWLAAALALMTAAPATAKNIPSADDVNADEKAVVARLQAAAAKMDNNDNKGAEADLDALVAAPQFANASALTRAETLTLLGICESIDREPDAAFKHLSEAARTDPDVRTRLYWVELAFVADDLKKDDLLGEALTQTVLADPDSANTLSPGFVFNALRRLRALKDGGVHNRQLLEALIQVRYGPQSDPTAGESLRSFLFEAYADAGEDAKAQALVSSFTAPGTVISLRADNRYRKYLLADADLDDFKAVQDRYIDGLRSRQASGGPPVAQELAMALTSANRLPEALKVVDDALALGDLAPNAKTDEGDEAKWLLDTRTRILALMGRGTRSRRRKSRRATPRSRKVSTWSAKRSTWPIYTTALAARRTR